MFKELEAEGYLNLTGLRERGILGSSPTLRRWEAAGQFPRRIVVTPTATIWRLREIETWLANRPEGAR